MTFEGQYLTYAEYKDLIESEGGSAMAEMPFKILEFEARRQIDIRTFNRLKNSENIPQEVKLCDYALINSISSFANANDSIANNGNVKSENTDGYSVNYISPSEISEVVRSKNDEIQDIIETYLLGIIFNGEHLLYCGV